MTPIHTPIPYVGHVCGCAGAHAGTYRHMNSGLSAATSVSFETDPTPPTLNTKPTEAS